MENIWNSYRSRTRMLSQAEFTKIQEVSAVEEESLAPLGTVLETLRLSKKISNLIRFACDSIASDIRMVLQNAFLETIYTTPAPYQTLGIQSKNNHGQYMVSAKNLMQRS